MRVISNASDLFSYLDIGRVFGAIVVWIGDAYAGSCMLARAYPLGGFAIASHAATKEVTVVQCIVEGCRGREREGTETKCHSKPFNHPEHDAFAWI